MAVMDKALKDALKDCQGADWFGRCDGVWVGEIKGQPLKTDPKLMDELFRSGYIKDAGRPSRPPAYKGVIQDWDVTDAGQSVLAASAPESE